MKKEKTKGKKLKDYSIKTKITIEEHRERYKDDGGYTQPFKSYSYIIDYGSWRKMSGGFKTKEELFKSIEEEF